MEKWQESLIPALATAEPLEHSEVSVPDKADLEAIALTQAEEVAKRTRELLDHQVWCLWECSVLGNEVIAIVRDELVEGLPEGVPVYTEAELRTLFDKPLPRSTLRLIHEAKKKTVAKVITDARLLSPTRQE
jgi:hypothetical protein